MMLLSELCFDCISSSDFFIKFILICCWESCGHLRGWVYTLLSFTFSSLLSWSLSDIHHEPHWYWPYCPGTVRMLGADAVSTWSRGHTRQGRAVQHKEWGELGLSHPEYQDLFSPYKKAKAQLIPLQLVHQIKVEVGKNRRKTKYKVWNMNYDMN